MGKTTWKFDDSVAGAMTTSSNTCALISLPPMKSCGKHLLTRESEKQSYITFAPVRLMPPIQVVMPESPDTMPCITILTPLASVTDLN